MSSQTFFTTQRDLAKLVPIDKILMTRHVATAVKDMGGSVSGKSFKGDPANHGFPLARMYNMCDTFNTCVRVPPVTVTPITSKGETYYRIIDGRHRFACSIVNDYTHIPIKK